MSLAPLVVDATAHSNGSETFQDNPLLVAYWKRRGGLISLPTMSTISTHLRNFKEPTKEQLTDLFFALPSAVGGHGGADASSPGPGASSEKTAATGSPETELEKMEINAVLSLGVQGEEVEGEC